MTSSEMPSWAMPAAQAMQRHSGSWKSLRPTENPAKIETQTIKTDKQSTQATDRSAPNATGGENDPPPVVSPNPRE
jgi:hypothetical protein